MAEHKQQQQMQLKEQRSHPSHYRLLSRMAKRLLIALVVVLSLVLPFSIHHQPVLAATSTQLLLPDDLPSGFTAYSGPDIGNCTPSEHQGNAFALQEDAAIAEIVCVSSVSIDSIVENNQSDSSLGIAFFDAMLSNPDAFIQVLGQEKPENLQFLDLNGVGDKAIGFRGRVDDIGNTDIAIFRRDNTLNTVFVIHPDRAAPLTSIQSLAAKVDQRVRSPK